MNQEFKEAVVIADDLESEIAGMDLDLTYKEIARVAKFTAIKIKQQIPMYVGNLNPKWKLYDNVCNILRGRINGEDSPNQ